MDPVTVAKTAQIVHSLARSKKIRQIVTGIIAFAVLGWVLVMAAPVMLIASLTFGGSAQVAAMQQARTDGSCAAQGTTPPEGMPNLTAEQVGNARTIWRTARQEGLADRAAVIAIATALQESSLRNLAGGDRDSVGLFQQRPSQGWGTVAQLRTPSIAAQKFYDALVKINGWPTMPLTQAAQAVQRSAFPDAYAKWERQAAGLVAHFNTTPTSSGNSEVAEANRQAIAGTCGTGAAGQMICKATGSPAESGLTPDALRVIRCLSQNFGELRDFGGVGDRPATVDDDHQTGRAIDAMVPDYRSAGGRALGDRMAAWILQNREALGVKYIIWNEKIWSVARQKEGWRPYTSPTGGNTDTLRHRDHVHTSVNGNTGTNPTNTGGQAVTPVASYTLTARYGQCGRMWSDCHTGLDFATPEGTPIRAVRAGTIAFAGWAGRLGNLTKITHPDGTTSWYAHQQRTLVPAGQQVQAGQQIGLVGATGNVTGPHVHLEIRVGGKPVDPEPWYHTQGVRP